MCVNHMIAVLTKDSCGKLIGLCGMLWPIAACSVLNHMIAALTKDSCGKLGLCAGVCGDYM